MSGIIEFRQLTKRFGKTIVFRDLDLIHERFLTLMGTESTTVVLVTHDMDEAVRLADELIVIRDGAILRQGVVDRVVGSGDTYVSRLFGRRHSP